MAKPPGNIVQQGRQLDSDMPFDLNIETHHWPLENDGHCRDHIYGWLNPDPSSPVAAIMMRYIYLADNHRYQNHPPTLQLNIDLVPRPNMMVGRLDWLEESDTSPLYVSELSSLDVMNIHAAKYGVRWGNKGAYYATELEEMGVGQACDPDTRYMCTLMERMVRDPASKLVMIKEAQDIMRYLAKQHILSKDPAVRQALLQAVSQTMTSIPELPLSLEDEKNKDGRS